MEQIDVGKLLIGISKSEDLTYMLLSRKEDPGQLISRIIYYYLNKELNTINKDVLTKYGYGNIRYNFFMLNNSEILYDKKVVYRINTNDRLEDILADFYSNKNRIIKECDKIIAKVVYFSNEYNTFVDSLAAVMNSDKSLKLSKLFKITKDIPYDTVDMKTFETVKSSFFSRSMYNDICKKSVINYGHIKINIPYNVMKHPRPAASCWKMNSFRQEVLKNIAKNLVMLIDVYGSRTSLVEQKFIINNYDNHNKIKKIFDNYKFTCATTKKFIKNNESAFNNKFATIPEFK